MVAVSDLEGSGGAERLFGQLHAFLTKHPDGAQVTLVTAASSLERLRAAGLLHDATGVVSLRLGARPGRGKPAIAWMTLRLLWATLRRGFDVVHICLPSPIYVPYVAVLGWLPDSMRPKTAINVIDCTLASSFEVAPPEGTYERQVLEAHRMYFAWARLDGVYSWYRAFVDIAARQRALAVQTLVRAGQFCFAETARFNPAAVKEDVVVWAGRLSEQKRPLLFVDAVAALRRLEPQLIEGWRFELYGKGMLADQVAERIREYGLNDVLSLSHAIDMAPIFARSRLFVSTQAIENFTSLAMLEAMAAGNGVIAENVGQTAEFVRHGENGTLVPNARPETFARAIADLIRHKSDHPRMAAASRAVATDVHTVDHFAGDIRAFWQDLLTRRAA
jgi:glycosyltransferase involved in cell wall biosynthesis